MLANTLDGQTDKRNPQDFALWKEQNHSTLCAGLHHGVTVSWMAFECTAMSTKYLVIILTFTVVEWI
jgi:cysteinyl-tRNA synthetase